MFRLKFLVLLVILAFNEVKCKKENQAESASAIKNLIDETPENLEVIIESEIIPALIRTLISTDENVLEKVIETLATIISKHPSLRNKYMDLNIVESLLMSYSPDMPIKMHDDMVRIITHLFQNDDIPYSSGTETFVSSMMSVLSELIYTYDSKTLVLFMQDILETELFDRKDIVINIEIVEKCFSLLSHQDDLVGKSAASLIFIASKNENVIQHFLEKGILEFIKDNFNADLRSPISSAGITIITSIVSSKNVKHFQAIFDAGLIPYVILYLNPKYDAEDRGRAIAVLMQISKVGTSSQLSSLINYNIIPKICQMLKNSDFENENEFEQDIQNSAVLIIFSLIRNNEKAFKPLKEGKMIHILNQFLTRQDISPMASALLKKLENDFENLDKIMRKEL